MWKKFLLAAAVAMGLSCHAAAQNITVRIGGFEPGIAMGRSFAEFKRMVEAESNGRIKVQLFPGEQLGSLVEQLEHVRQGAQEMALVSPGWFSRFYPRADVLELPFLVTDWDQAQRMLNSQAFRDLALAAAKETDLYSYGKFPYGFRNIANSKRPIKTLEDMRGLKLRTQNSPAHLASFRALGANPIAIAWGETYQAVQTGVVDGLENGSLILAAHKFPEIAKYVSETRHLFGMLLAYVNIKFLDKLSAADRAILDKAMAAAEEMNIRLSREAEVKANNDLRALGAVINEVSPEVIKSMQAAVQPVYDSLGAKFEPDLSALRKAANP